VLAGRPGIILDVAHNPHAAHALAANLDSMGFFSYTHAVFGAMRDKDIGAILAALGDRVDHWYLATLATPRAAQARDIAALVPREDSLAAQSSRSVRCFDDPQSAWRAARERALENDRIVVFGSFYTVAAVMQLLAESRH
jgi:dihydrofolate synthase/folylpolyglutamate synthase